MAIVEDYYIGKTHVLIDDSYVVKTQEEVDRILQNLYKIYMKSEMLKFQKKLQQDEAEKDGE